MDIVVLVRELGGEQRDGEGALMASESACKREEDKWVECEWEGKEEEEQKSWSGSHSEFLL